MSLYNKYRPTSLDKVIGNAGVVSELKAVLANEERPHCFMLTGPTGCGKTTLGRIIANELGCQEDDYKELDSADFRGIDTIRELRRNSQYKALKGSVRVWLLDECHKLTNDAQNALLKGLEDPPEHCYYILCTTDPHRLIDTVKNRCVQFVVSTLTEIEMVRLLYRIASSEDVMLDKQLLRLIYQKSGGIEGGSGGHPRAAIQLLEKVIAVDESQRAKVIADAESFVERVSNLARTLNGKAGWKAVADILKDIEETDVESTRRGLLAWFAKVLLNGENDHAMMVLDQMITPFYDSGKAGLVHACYMICHE